jgi:adenosine deaminase
MNGRQPALADLHQHLLGSIHWQDFLQFLINRPVDWSFYESGYCGVYGKDPDICRMLEEAGRGVPGSEEEFRRLFVFQDEDGGSFERFQAKYNMLVSGSGRSALPSGSSAHSTLALDTANFLRQILDRQLQQGVNYSEQRCTLSRGYTQEQARELLLTLLAACAEYDSSEIQPRLAISLSREDPWVHWDLIKEVTLGEYGHLLTGLDFCYFEEGYPPKDQRRLFESVKDFNLRHPELALAILYHVGESFADKSLESAVRWVHQVAGLGAHRLGHAIALGINPDLYGKHIRHESVAERIDQLRYDLRHLDGLSGFGVSLDSDGLRLELKRLQSLPLGDLVSIEYDEPRLKELRLRQRYAAQCISGLGSIIEVCPTSNLRIAGITEIEHHPIRRFVEFGVPFVVGSDDPGIFDTTLAEEINAAIAIAGLPPDSYGAIAERSWRCRSEALAGRTGT